MQAIGAIQASPTAGVEYNQKFYKNNKQKGNKPKMDVTNLGLGVNMPTLNRQQRRALSNGKK